MAKTSFFVQGRIVARSLAGVGGLRVEIVDRNVGGDKLVKETTTDADGRFEATFTPATSGKAALDLQARAYAGKARIGVSEVRYNASPRETLNVQLDEGAAAALPDEHQALSQAIGAHFQGALRKLEEKGERQDITYLAHKTGWDARAVAMAALADQFAERAGGKIDAAVFYALFRAGLPANEDAVYNADGAALAAALARAVDAGVIGKKRLGEASGVVKEIQAAGAKKILKRVPRAGVSTLQEMLQASDLDAAQQKRFAEIYAEHRADSTAFWKAVGGAFDKKVAARLEVDGKLARLTLNNAPLMARLRAAAAIGSTLELAARGLHRAEAWSTVLKDDIKVPKEIPGGTPKEKRANYAAYLAAQVRLAHPTAAVAEMVASRRLVLADAGGKPASAEVVNEVHAFLTANHGKFEIGVEPVERYVKRSGVKIAPEALAQVERVQRVYQITPDDHVLEVMLARGIDAAYHVVRHDRSAFVGELAKDVGEARAAVTYDRAVQVHHAVLNVAVAYLTASNAPGIGVHSDPSIVAPAPHASDVIAYATLEQLLGEMDYCECDHCRSILSPAAYLVDLLMFVNQPTHPADRENPQTVLLQRRPDLENLPLTCENTNTALPYIDLVNETLEYFIANTTRAFSLNGYRGHDTGDAASADLLANPRFVMDGAYTTLRSAKFPAPLPFHQPLESLRRHFAKFGAPLPLAMEAMRRSDALERGANPYGWRDILMEGLGISRIDADLLATSAAAPNTLAEPYGYAAGTPDASIIAALAIAKAFSRRIGVSYMELAAILRTRFVNPNAELIARLARLGVPFAELKRLKDTNSGAGDAAFDALLPTGAAAPDPQEYGGDIKAWVKDNANFARIMAIVTLVDPTGATDECNFDRLELRFSKPMSGPADNSTRLGVVEYVRLLRFIRVWRKLGWTIDEVDTALCALWRADLEALQAADIDSVAKLDAGFLLAIPRLGVVKRVMDALELKPARDLAAVLACWTDIGTQGEGSLYRRMFLDPALASPDAAFADNGYGRFFTAAVAPHLLDHAEALRSAFSLTAEEFALIVQALGYDAATPLGIRTVTAVFRRGWLARKLRISVRELLLLVSLTGLDPFAAPDPTGPAILALARLVKDMKDRALPSSAALYLVWNEDLSGKSAPDPGQVADLARALRADFADIEDQLALKEDPGGDIARARMALAYGQATADAFFALVDDTLALDVGYTHGASTLEAAITAADTRIAYDHFRHRLSYTGVLTATRRAALVGVAGVTMPFQQAVDALFARSEDQQGSFFTRYPELQPLYAAYLASADPPATKRMNLLAAFRPELSRRRKRQQALQRVTATAMVDLELTQAILDAPSAPFPLHAAANAARPALDDALALETPGLAAQFFFRDTATGAVDLAVPAAANLGYARGGGNALPANTTTPGNAISAIWRGALETPEAGFYNVAIEADEAATVSLRLAGSPVALAHNGRIWRNAAALELQASKLVEVVLTVERVRDTVSFQWETPKRAREVVPPRYLYPPGLLAPFSGAYVRFLKAASIAKALGLTPAELAYFANHADNRVAGDGWLNALPVAGPAAAPAALLTPLRNLLDYARIKSELSIADDALIAALRDPAAATATPQSLLYTLTRWNAASLASLRAHFGAAVADLAHIGTLARVHDAFALLANLGISADALVAAATNEPTGTVVRDLQAALRARYDAADWRTVVQPINDEMRGLQRDALVAYILHGMRSDPTTAHIDTVDKLFEYFLMDVQMEPCMQTSRIRHALSSVQLFIERCLMNLEPRVSPASINAKQWEWMKRYRVWEANRKVFLFPENWLEPELRDDKSPFFKEIESELMQSDITEDSATTALLNYLSKLEDVAKLEPCGIHRVAANAALRTGDVDHVIARTTGAKRNYYYRRREYGYWTPWEAIKLEIEDNPIVPVVWKGRLLLFWVRIVQQATDAAAASAAPAGALSSGMQASSAVSASAMKSSVRAVLCWSEYYNGKWQPAKTSEIDRPTQLGEFTAGGVGAFHRSRLSLLTSDNGDFLYVAIAGPSFNMGIDSSWFVLYNTHSAPVRREDATGITPSYAILHPRIISTEGPSLGAMYGDYEAVGSLGVPNIDFTISHAILDQGRQDSKLEPTQEMASTWQAPFFYLDRRHAYYVTPSMQSKFIGDNGPYGVVTIDAGAVVRKVPPLVVKFDPREEGRPRLLGSDGPIGPDGPVIDPGVMERFVTEDAYIRVGIGGAGGLNYGGVRIGPDGATGRRT